MLRFRSRTAPFLLLLTACILGSAPLARAQEADTSIGSVNAVLQREIDSLQVLRDRLQKELERLRGRVESLREEYGSRPPPPRQNQFTADATYVVTGTAERIRITFFDRNGSLSQRVVEPPYYYIFPIAQGQPLYVAGENLTHAGSVTVKIYSQGRLLKRATSRGPGVRVSARAVRP